MRSADEPPAPKTVKVRQRAPGAGRPRKPTALHVLDGTRTRTDRSREPKPAPASRASAPAWLAKLDDEGLAVQFFERVAKGLIALGVLTDLDVDALAIVAESYSVYRRCTASIPLKIEAPEKGRVPIVFSVRRQALRDVHMGLAQFGLSPVARTKVIAGGEVPLPPSAGAQQSSSDRGADWMHRYAPASPA